MSQLSKRDFFLHTTKSMKTEQTDAEFADLAKSIKRETNVAGWAVENAKGQRIYQMVEIPTLASTDVRDQPIARLRSGNRYDVAWNGKQLGSDYVFVVRHNVEFIQHELVSYVWRIIGLVAIISLFVTASTLAILRVIVILPILKLREDLELVADSISQDQMNLQFHSMATLRTDEVGDVMAAFNQMYVRIIKEISERKRAEALIQ